MSRTRAALIAGRYELTGRVLAAGGMGRVLDGHDIKLDRPVAIKLLASTVGNTPGARKRFRSEAVNTAALSHPNVVAVFDAGEHDGQAYIVMERLPGATLAGELMQGPMDASRAIGLIQQVLSALDVAHAKGIIHRDVKPGNVLIAEDGSAKLSDFGIAKLLEQDATMTRDLLGTPAYVAPELVQGRAASAQSDLYAVGIMLFEALAGRKPFSGEPALAHLAAAQAAQLPSLRDVAPWVPESLASVVDRATRVDPEDRYASAAEMSLALAAAASGTDATARLPVADPATTAVLRPPPPAPVPRRKVRGSRVALLAACIAAVAIVVALVASLGSAPKVSTRESVPSTTLPGRVAPLPAPIESALVQLEQAVTR